MEKTAQRNIMAIYEDWRIFRKILKRDLALDRTSGRRWIVHASCVTVMTRGSSDRLRRRECMEWLEHVVQRCGCGENSSSSVGWTRADSAMDKQLESFWFT